jgi:protocatechuate 3,4-dioxygenase, alpha subunit
MKLVAIPSQTVGPYFHLGLTGHRAIGCMARPGARGEQVKVIFTVVDADGIPVNDAMIEIWQADAEGKYNHPEDTQDKAVDPACPGFGRMGTDANGVCEFDTVKPGQVPGPGNTLQAPHLNVSVFARGVLKRLATRVYFGDDPANDHDPILALVPADRRSTLLAQPDPAHPGTWRFHVHLSGEQETAFFDV